MRETHVTLRCLHARNVLSVTLGTQAGDDVIVETWDHGLPIAEAFVHQIRNLGAHPMLLLEHEEAFWKDVESISGDKLGKVGEHESAAIEKAKGYVFITGPGDIREDLEEPRQIRVHDRLQ